jgi:hypothetical protein
MMLLFQVNLRQPLLRQQLPVQLLLLLLVMVVVKVTMFQPLPPQPCCFRLPQPLLLPLLKLVVYL